MKRHKDVIEVYNNLIRQMTNNIGKSINIASPYETDNVAVRDFHVTLSIYNRIVRRRDYLLGGIK